MTVRYRYKSILKDGGVEVFDRRGDTGDLNSRLNIISTVLNNTGASWLQYGDAWLESDSTVHQQEVIEMRETYYDDNGNVVGTYLDEYFLSIDVQRTVKQFYDPDNPFNLSVADRV